MSQLSSLALPTIHLGGTGRKMLQDGYDQADESLTAFIDAWQAIEFNARDYYVQQQGEWDRAVIQRQEFTCKIHEIREYIQAHREHLYDL